MATINWTSSNPHEPTATAGRRLLWICVGSPNLYCFSDGKYLGSETTMAAAKRRCEKNERGKYVSQPMTTEEEFKALKPKPVKMVWVSSKDMKDTWTSVVKDEKVPARIRKLDERTWATYRNGEYLGSEATRNNAEMRAAINKRSDENRVMRLWEKLHPDELPPYLMMTDEERKLYRERNPPARITRAPSGAKVVEDPATRKLREALAQEGSGGRAGRAKVAKAGGKAAAAPEGIIRVLKADNPKKAGSDAHARWALLFTMNGKTVKEYAEAKGNLTTLENAVKKGNVKVEKE